MKPDPYEQMQQERARHRAAVVRELNAVVQRHGCTAHYAAERGIYLTAACKDSRIEWLWSFKARGAHFDLVTLGANENAAVTLRSLADALDDPDFDAALSTAVQRVEPATAPITRARTGFGSGAIDDTSGT